MSWNRRTHFIIVCLITFLTGLAAASLQAKDQIVLTVLYDNYTATEGIESDWGFSCLIEGMEKVILFDAGAKSDLLFRNAERLNVDLDKVQMIVISHSHFDHAGGIAKILDNNPEVTVYFPASFRKELVDNIAAKSAKPVRVSEPVEIFRGAYLTGEMGYGIKEQSLILDTEEGLVIITGCSHQGIVNILERAKELHQKNIYLVFGGFHLLQHSDEQINEIIQKFKLLGVKKCGATHCTGGQAIGLFEEAYGEDFISIGAGKVLRFSH
ncbi:MAG: MBL fold metallo-hydrolase [Fidelibacterota bacterium]|nr:MAG: MBL fold metallo-hydrolase [Candidatus Neomarinimicrobiota bacterium]